MRSLAELQEKMGYNFKDERLLCAALTHSSSANEQRSPLSSNERLEFLGDSVLGVIVSDMLYRKMKNLPEGELTKKRAALVCEKALFEFAQGICLGEHLSLGRGEEHNGGRNRPSIVADAFEAVIAAVYLDGGMSAAKKFVTGFTENKLRAGEKEAALKDYKTLLQEIIQKNPEEKLSYGLESESGPAHCRKFEVKVLLNSNIIGRGEGHSKKEAEQAAAKEALLLMGHE